MNIIRIIQYVEDPMRGGWKEGVLHAFVESGAIVEKADTGELLCVPVDPARLKFEVPTKTLVARQMAAAREAQTRAVQAGPIPQDRSPGF